MKLILQEITKKVDNLLDVLHHTIDPNTWIRLILSLSVATSSYEFSISSIRVVKIGVWPCLGAFTQGHAHLVKGVNHTLKMDKKLPVYLASNSRMRIYSAFSRDHRYRYFL